MAIKIDASQLAEEVQKALDEYQDATIDTLKKAVDKSAKDAVKQLKSTSPKLTGAYAKSWTDKEDKTQKNKWAYARIVYNKKHYRLTHLLEKGHRVVNTVKAGKKTWVDPQAHIEDAEQDAIDELVNDLKENL